MFPTSFDEENIIFDKPANMTADQCESISAWRGMLDSGFPGVITCWKLSKDELLEINKTGKIWVIVVGETTPPLCPTVFKPFDT